MATQDDVRLIALALPETIEEADGFAFSVADKGKQKKIAWVWRERVHPKKARVPNPSVLAVRVESLDAKDALLALGDEAFFTEPHYDGYPAVLVRLAKIGKKELRALITDAWRCQAPPALVKQREGVEAPASRKGREKQGIATQAKRTSRDGRSSRRPRD